MEFKGTKDLITEGKFSTEVYNGDFLVALFFVNRSNLRNGQKTSPEAKANALIFSKAPEMLEMLNKVLEINKLHNFDGHLINEQIEQLIKQATEI